MKILQINSVCGIGSTGRIATDIHQVLIDKGHESYIAYGRDLPKNCDKAIRIGTDFDNYIHVLQTRLFDRHGFGSKKATRKFVEQVKELDPDIIHLHNIHGYFINIEILFKYLKEANKKIIWTLHDCWSFTGHCAYFDFARCDKWKTRCYDCPQKTEYPSSLFFDNSHNNYLQKKLLFSGVKDLTIVTPSKWLAGLVKQSFLSDYPVEVINNGIDLNVFKPSQSSFRSKYQIENKFIILGVASEWSRRKGLQYFIELAKFLNKEKIIVLIGLSEKQIKGLPENIIGITKTNNVVELAEIYSCADVFVNPTLEDNFPTTNIESLACGTPVITFDTGGSGESIDENTGIVVEKGNIEQLEFVINSLQPKTNKDIEVTCKNRATQHYNKLNQFGEYFNVYKKEKIE